MDKIQIKKSPNADTRTCDWLKVSKDQLHASSVQHIGDVSKGLQFFADRLKEADEKHDHDKLSDLEGFHRDFQTGFATTEWWEKHRRVNRHHLSMADGIPEDVNLIDVIEYITDCVMAGLARSGEIYELKISPETLDKAFHNTVDMLKNNVEVVE